MLDKIITCLFAGVSLTLKMAVIAIPLVLALMCIWRVYQSKGGKKSFGDYACMVLENLLDLFNEWLENLFK